MRVLILLLMLLGAAVVAVPGADACHPVDDRPPGQPVWFDHGCGGPTYVCVQVNRVVECVPLGP